ncbi:MAG: anti-sigma factor domain-containing protein [Erythrobacter cryptus]
MSTPEDNAPDAPERDDPMIAAEWSLGLLEGEELLAARGKYATDPAFAWRKEWWDGWFAPLADAIPGAEPGEHVWQAIAARVAAQRAAAAEPEQLGARIADLEARLRRWRWIAGLASAAAVVALAWLALGPLRAPAEPPTPMVAAIPLGEGGLRLDVTYVPESRRMIVTALGLAADGVHDHQLWLVGPDGRALHSLGVIAPGTVRSMALPDELAAQIGEGARLVLTREPIGGKPAGAAAGPVVARGTLGRV